MKEMILKKFENPWAFFVSYGTENQGKESMCKYHLVHEW